MISSASAGLLHCRSEPGVSSSGGGTQQQADAGQALRYYMQHAQALGQPVMGQDAMALLTAYYRAVRCTEDAPQVSAGEHRGRGGSTEACGRERKGSSSGLSC